MDKITEPLKKMLDNKIDRYFGIIMLSSSCNLILEFVSCDFIHKKCVKKPNEDGRRC